jgi:hypothetical protein
MMQDSVRPQALTRMMQSSVRQSRYENAANDILTLMMQDSVSANPSISSFGTPPPPTLVTPSKPYDPNNPNEPELKY